MVLIDVKSLVIVVGGTVTAALSSFSIKDIFILLKVFFKRVFGLNTPKYLEIIHEVVELSKINNRGKKAFEGAISSLKHPFLKDGAEALFWSESNISDTELRELLETRAMTHYTEYMSGANVFRTIAKFPPAFGLLGTTLGMIRLLQSFDGSGGINNIGPAMAIALITTFYGVALSNFVLIPIGEYLAKQTREDYLARIILVEGLMLIHQKKPIKFVEERLKSYLLPSKRQTF